MVHWQTSKLGVATSMVIQKLKSLFNQRRRTKNQSIKKIPLISFLSIFKNYNLFGDKVCKVSRYWSRRSTSEIIEDADNMFLGERYIEVYELLNRLKFSDNVEVQWRLCRVLFKMAQNYSKEIHREMITEAYNLMKATDVLSSNNGNVHKWLAIITDARAGLEGVTTRIKSYETVKEHLLRASELNPDDVAVWYMLGRWCYQISNFTWLQRKITCLFFDTCPSASFEEAHGYFVKAEELQPRFYLPNLYMLGCTSFRLNQIFRAKYYLSIAAQLTPRNPYETDCAAAASRLGKTLLTFDVSESNILSNN